MKNFISIHDVDDPESLLAKAIDCKEKPFAQRELGINKTLVMVFFNPSLRTRLSTERAALNLGISVMSMNAAQGWQLEFEDEVVMNSNKAEHIREAAAVISQYADIIAVRTFPSLTDKKADYQDRVIRKFQEFASVPVISLESAIRHPLQSLADWLTIETFKKVERPKVVLSWAPHPKALPQAVANSFLEWMYQANVELSITHPEGYELATEFAKDIPVYHDQNTALEDADFVYVKNWSSYTDYGKIKSKDTSWMITPEKMALTNDGYFMHCLPVRRNVVVADKVLDSKTSLTIEQANNRTFAAQAVLWSCLEGLKG